MAIIMRSKNFLCLSRLKSLTRFQRYSHSFDERGLQAEMGPLPNHDLHPIDPSKWEKIQSRKMGITDSMSPFPSWFVSITLHKAGQEEISSCTDYWTKISNLQVAQDDEDKETALSSLIPNGCDEKDLIRWRNSRNRDFTINSLFFDPFACIIYDYNNGVSDLKSLKLRTLVPAHVSFKKDCGRILRGLRIAARLGLSITRDTESAMYNLSASIDGLDKSRLMLELNNMLSYGAAESSICLLQRFNLLSILLPLQAAYINQQRSAKNSMMLMKLFFNLDKLVSCDQPADSSLWIALLMFHHALVNNPQDAIIVLTFASLLYHGKWKEGIEFASKHTKVEVKFVPEISGFSENKPDEDLAREVAHFASLVQDSVWALTETSGLFYSMSRYPFYPCSGLVFVPKKTAKDTAEFFNLMGEDIKSFISRRQRERPGINYYLLGKGDPCETRFVLGKIILETMKAGPLEDAAEVASDQKDLPQPKGNDEIRANNQVALKMDKRNQAKKHAKVVEKSKHHIPPHAVSKKHMLDEMVKEKPEKHKAVRDRSGVTLLSSLFK